MAVLMVLMTLVFGLALALLWGRPFRRRWRPWGSRMVPPLILRPRLATRRRHWGYRRWQGRRW